MNNSINEITDSIWSAIQRGKPSVTREEIAVILRDALEAPTADETPRDYIKIKFTDPAVMSAVDAENDAKLRAFYGDGYESN